jgi:YhcH/YjgK/YiaL family protein
LVIACSLAGNRIFDENFKIMAVYGTLDVLLAQQPQHKLVAKGLDYLNSADVAGVFANVTPGNNVVVEIDGKNLFAIFQTYDTKPMPEMKFEGHQKYIDIQYVFAGEEIIGVTGWDQVLAEGDYDDEKDIHFPDVHKYTELLMLPGYGCILYPDDLHAPCLAVEDSERVLKVVVKVAV